MTAKRLLFRLLAVTAVTGAAYLLYKSFSQYTWLEVRESVRQIPLGRLLASMGFAAASYICLSGFDTLALIYVGKPLAYRRTLLASFTSLSIGHNVGVSAMSSGAVRYRFYSRWGLTAAEVGKLILFCGMTVALGLVSLAGLLLAAQPGVAGELLGIGQAASVAVAVGCLAVPIVYLVMAALFKTPFKLWKWTVAPPGLRLALAQVAVGTVNFICVAACLNQLLAAFTEAGYLKVATAYVTANITAIVSHVPGGLGVLEATVLYILPGATSIGALLAFRVVYFFLPLAIGLPLFLGSEAIVRAQAKKASGQTDTVTQDRLRISRS
jgi:uncharacterized membrane protein YbhN (UPF0104 family)